LSATEAEIRINENDSPTTMGKLRDRVLTQQLKKFLYVSVWLPYLLNQAGSLLFYFCLSNTSLSIVVPACNAMALVFSLLTTWIIEERVNKPCRSVAGAACVLLGVALCVQANP
jgi:uncharacterized membrane protein